MSYTLFSEALFNTLGLKGEAMWPSSEKRRQKVSIRGSFSYIVTSESSRIHIESTVSGVFAFGYNSRRQLTGGTDSLVRQLLLLREYERMSL